MKKILIYIRYLLLIALTAVLTGCWGAINRHDNEECTYTLLLKYHYNEENTSQGVNRVEYYVYEIDEYIFDEAGILFDYRRIQPDPCREMMDSEWDLPPGRYSVIAVGNRDERSFVSDGDCSTQEPRKGITHRDDLMLMLRNCEEMGNGTRGTSERLYHGYKTVTVTEQEVSRVKVDMINAHMRLKFRVRWKGGTTPSRDGSYYAILESVPSEYRLMPEYIFPATETSCCKHESELHDEYPVNCNKTIHHIPHVCYKGDNVLTHRHNTGINADLEMWGEFTTYRVLHTTRPKLRIFREGSESRAADEQIVVSIDLQAYFDSQGYATTTALKQDYELNIEVQPNGTAIINPLDISDWDEGGMIQ